MRKDHGGRALLLPILWKDVQRKALPPAACQSSDCRGLLALRQPGTLNTGAEGLPHLEAADVSGSRRRRSTYRLRFRSVRGRTLPGSADQECNCRFGIPVHLPLDSLGDVPGLGAPVSSLVITKKRTR